MQEKKKYRKIDPNIWNDEKFIELSDDGKLGFLFLLTHPHMTSLGAMRGSLPGLSHELGWTTERLSQSLSQSLSQRMIVYVPKASFIWLPNALKYNAPENPNVVKAWAKIYADLPECAEKYELYQAVKDFLKGFSEGFAKGWAFPLPNQGTRSKEQGARKPNPTLTGYRDVTTSTRVDEETGEIFGEEF